MMGLGWKLRSTEVNSKYWPYHPWRSFIVLLTSVGSSVSMQAYIQICINLLSLARLLPWLARGQRSWTCTCWCLPCWYAWQGQGSLQTWVRKVPLIVLMGFRFSDKLQGKDLLIELRWDAFKKSKANEFTGESDTSTHILWHPLRKGWQLEREREPVWGCACMWGWKVKASQDKAGFPEKHQRDD